VAGLGLGYHRDLQVVKREGLGVLARTAQLLTLVTSVVRGTAYRDVGYESADTIIATDLAEALVASGTPFRQAYAKVAKAMHALEQGMGRDESLTALGLGDDVAALLGPDAARRVTTGGPAPASVVASLNDLSAASVTLGKRLAALSETTRRPLALLSTPPHELIASLEAS